MTKHTIDPRLTVIVHGEARVGLSTVLESVGLRLVAHDDATSTWRPTANTTDEPAVGARCEEPNNGT